MHPFYTLLLNRQASPLNEPVQGYHPLYDLLMMEPPSDEQEDLAAIFGSTLGVIMPWYMQAPPIPPEDLAAMVGSTIGVLLGHYADDRQP